jgi:hypothetical protein
VSIYTKIVSLSLFSFMATAGFPTGEKRTVKMAQSIMQASPESLESAAAKITYLGPQEKPIRTILFSPMLDETRLDRFAKIQFAHRLYPNDVPGNVDHFSVTPLEFHRVLTALRDVVEVREGERPTFLSFAVIRQDDQRFKGAEFSIQQTTARRFYKILRDALEKENEPGRRMLLTQELNILPKE